MLEGEMTTWEDNFREAAEAKGRAQGLTQGRAQGLSEGLSKGLAQGRTELLVKMARHKFGEVPAAEVATLLKTVQSGEALDAAGELLLTCHSGEELLSRIREI
jgi:flagellar biosynthesis/type III secretory pathway protein FliH